MDILTIEDYNGIRLDFRNRYGTFSYNSGVYNIIIISILTS